MTLIVHEPFTSEEHLRERIRQVRDARVIPISPDLEGPGRRIYIADAGFNAEIADFYYWTKTQPVEPRHERTETRYFSPSEIVATQYTLEQGLVEQLLQTYLDYVFVCGGKYPDERTVRLEEYTMGKYHVIDGHHGLAYSFATGEPVVAKIRSVYDKT